MTRTRDDTPSVPGGRTALGRAHGRHRALLLATCVALLLAAIGDEVTGYDGPGPLIYPVFALVVALAPGRFTPLAVAAMSTFFVVGGLASPAFVHQLLDTGRLGALAAGWLQMTGLAIAAACAVATVVVAPPRAPSPDPDGATDPCT